MDHDFDMHINRDSVTLAEEIVTRVTGKVSKDWEYDHLNAAIAISTGLYDALVGVYSRSDDFTFAKTPKSNYYPRSDAARSMLAHIQTGLGASGDAGYMMFAKYKDLNHNQAARYVLRSLCDVLGHQAVVPDQPRRPPVAGAKLTTMGYFVAWPRNKLSIIPCPPGP